MLSTTLFTAALAALASIASSSPISILEQRAGAPEIVPIPPSCTIYNPLNISTTYQPSGLRYRPSDAFVDASSVYANTYANNNNHKEIFTTCLKQCYGFGNTGDCVAAYIAWNVPDSLSLTGTGFDTFRCTFFKDPITPDVLVKVTEPKGQYMAAQAANIDCP